MIVSNNMKWYEYWKVEDGSPTEPICPFSEDLLKRVQFILLATNISGNLENWIKTRICKTHYGTGEGDNLTQITGHLSQLSQILSDKTDFAIELNHWQDLLNKLRFQYCDEKLVDISMEDYQKTHLIDNTITGISLKPSNPSHMINCLKSWEDSLDRFTKLKEKLNLIENTAPLQKAVGTGTNPGYWTHFWPLYKGLDDSIRILYKRERNIIQVFKVF